MTPARAEADHVVNRRPMRARGAYFASSSEHGTAVGPGRTESLVVPLHLQVMPYFAQTSLIGFGISAQKSHAGS